MNRATCRVAVVYRYMTTFRRNPTQCVCKEPTRPVRRRIARKVGHRTTMISPIPVSPRKSGLYQQFRHLVRRGARADSTARDLPIGGHACSLSTIFLRGASVAVASLLADPCVAGVRTAGHWRVFRSSCEQYLEHSHQHALPVASSSRSVNTIGATRGFHADFRSGVGRRPIGIPLSPCRGRKPNTQRPSDYAEDSDKGPTPFR